MAHGYRERHYPIDDLVIDWFHYTIMGQMDMDPRQMARSYSDEQRTAFAELPHHDQVSGPGSSLKAVTTTLC